MLIIASSLGILVFSLYINHLSISTKSKIGLVGERSWPILDKTKQLQFHFDHIVEQMHRAVSNHEKENLLKAEAELIAIKEIINDLSNLQPTYKERGKHLSELVSEYFARTREISEALINNSDDAPAKLIKDQEYIRENAVRISDALHSWSSEAEGNLINLIQLTQSSADATSNTAIISCVFVLMLGLLSYWTYRSNLIRPIQRLTQRAQRICDGQLDKISEQDLENRNDEFSGMAQALSNLLDSLQKNNLAFKEQNEKLIASTKAKSAFLANMSHEIRTPLASIIGFSEELLEDPDMPIEQRQAALSTIIQGGNHLRNIINDILDISKIEADKLQINPSQIMLIDLISEIRDLISMQSVKKGLDFVVEFQHEIPEAIDADALRLKQILLNLCSNACKFSDNGKVILKIEYSDLSNLLSFTVIDSGIGISADELPHIFDEFYQADSSASRKFGGTGLGLPISKKLANMMDGDITATSIFGKGSTFILKINAGKSALGKKIRNIVLNEARPVKVDTPKIDFPISENTDSERIRILLAEDTPDNQRLISMFLKRYNIDLVIVDNGKKAVDEATRNDYDLLLMDIQMPYMNGIEATDTLIKAGYRKPIIAVTANAMQDDISLYKKIGFSHVVAKPIVKKLLIDAIENHVNKTVNSIEIAKPKVVTQEKIAATESPPSKPVQPISPPALSVASSDIGLLKNVIEQLTQLEKRLNDSCAVEKRNSAKIVKVETTNSKQESNEPVVSTLFEDDPELLSILAKYVDDLKTAEKDISNAYQAKDWDLLKSHMHKVKGTGGAFGYPKLSEIAKKIHQQLQAGNIKQDVIAEQVEHFHQYCQRIFLGYTNNTDKKAGEAG